MRMYLLQISYLDEENDWDDDFFGYTSREKARRAGKKFEEDYYMGMIDSWEIIPYDYFPPAIQSRVRCLIADPAKQEKSYLKLLSYDTHKWRLNVDDQWYDTYTTNEMRGMGIDHLVGKINWIVRSVEIE